MFGKKKKEDKIVDDAFKKAFNTAPVYHVGETVWVRIDPPQQPQLAVVLDIDVYDKWHVLVEIKDTGKEVWVGSIDSPEVTKSFIC
jgi:hypothetical protein